MCVYIPLLSHLILAAQKEVVGQNLAIHGPIHPPLNTVQSSCPLYRKHPQSMFPPPCFMVGMVFLGLYSFFLQTRRVEFIPKCYILVSSDHMTSIPCLLDHPDGLWQTSDRSGHVLALAGGPCARCRILIHDGVVCY